MDSPSGSFRATGNLICHASAPGDDAQTDRAGSLRGPAAGAFGMGPRRHLVREDSL